MSDAVGGEPEPESVITIRRDDRCSGTDARESRSGRAVRSTRHASLWGEETRTRTEVFKLVKRRMSNPHKNIERI
jgi:hypothetical protein